MAKFQTKTYNALLVSCLYGCAWTCIILSAYVCMWRYCSCIFWYCVAKFQFSTKTYGAHLSATPAAYSLTLFSTFHTNNQPPWSPNILVVIFKSKWQSRDLTINPGCLLSYALFSQPKWVPSLNANNFSIQCTNNASLLGISYLRRMSFSSFLSSSSVFEDVKLMSARRVTFEMNMTLAHLPVLSSDLCLTVEQKLKRKLKKK